MFAPSAPTHQPSSKRLLLLRQAPAYGFGFYSLARLAALIPVHPQPPT